MNYSFNLIDENWIPCVRIRDSKTINISIKEALLNGESYQEIYDNSPLVTVAIYRLLLAICYRACEGPASHREARKIYSEGLPKQKISDYLDKWHHRFDLFDAEYPFLQIGGLTTDKPCGLNILATEIATGNNSTLFDHTNDNDLVDYSPDAAARLLLASLSYALGGTGSREGYIGEITRQGGSFYNANISGDTIKWISGNTLYQTLLINLMPNEQQQNDKAIWEIDNKINDNGSFSGKAFIYVWMSRFIRLLPVHNNNKINVSEAYLIQGKQCKEFDGMKSYVKSKEFGFIPLRLKEDKSVWRDSYALFKFNVFKEAEVIDYIAELEQLQVIEKDTNIIINVVGMVTNKAKVLLWRHEKMPTPAKLLSDESLIETLGVLLNESEEIARELRKRTRDLCRHYLETSSKSADKDEITRLTDSLDPERKYWSNLEQNFYILLKELVSDQNMAINNWIKAIERFAESAFEDSAEKLGTSARAIRAKAKTESRFYSQLREKISNNTKEEVMT